LPAVLAFAGAVSEHRGASFMQMLLAVMLCLLAAFGTNAPAAASAPYGPAAAEPIVFKTLLIVKRKTRIDQSPFMPVQADMTDEDVQAVTEAFEEHTAHWVNTLTEGRVQWEGKVVVSELPLKTVNGDKTCAACGPSNYAEELTRLAPVGKYDGVFIYFKHIDGRTGYTLPRAFGLTVGPNPDANHAGQTCINWAPASLWTRDSETTEIILHEWLHQLEAFYGDRGVRLPRGGLHGNVAHDYKYNGGWKDWYRDFLNGTIKEEADAVGLGERAWRLGTIRAAAPKGPHTKAKAAAAKPSGYAQAFPKYLLPHFASRPVGVRPVGARPVAENLLKDAGFEHGLDGRWELTTFRTDNARPMSMDPEVQRNGRASLRLSAEKQDDIRCRYTIPVEPYSNYLLSGWVRTEDVRIEEAGGKVGANLAVSTGEHSLSIDGTQEWSYVVVMFYSASQTEVEVIARLGGHGSTTTGTAWFDDLRAMKLTGKE